ncbi:MAG: MFS transporter [Limnobacter sp.]|nr:MFS transporter [Limnobacter sp.]
MRAREARTQGDESTQPAAGTGRPRARLFHGWIVVWSSFAAMTVIFGVAYSFAAFFDPFAREFDAQRADVSWVFGLSALLYFSLGAVGGALADRFGPRATGIAGMGCLAAGLLLSSIAQDLRSIYLAYGLGIGIGVALVYTPSMGAVLPWFVRRRGLASGIASSGIGAGTLLVPVLAAWLIASLDWREAMRWLALGVLLVGFVASWGLERDPARRGLAADGDTPAPAGAAPAGAPRKPPAGHRLGEAVRTPLFVWLYASVLLAGLPMFIPFAHLSASARDAGIAETESVALVGLIGIGSLVGRFGIGALADRLGRLSTQIIVELMMGASFALWAIAEGYPTFAAFALIFGLSYGGIVSLLPPICSDLFGLRAVSSIIGLLYTGAAFGALLGPVAAGALFDRSGNYAAAIAVCAACSVLAALAATRVLALSRRQPETAPA